MDINRESIVELGAVLQSTADRIVEHGTHSETRTLEAMSAAASAVSPGAAAALVDWSGSEPSRLRAFGLVHGVVLRGLGPADQLRLLAEIVGREHLALSA